MGFKSYKSLGSQNIQNAGSKISALEVVKPVKQTRLIAGGDATTTTIALSSDKGVSWTLPNNQPFTYGGFGRCGFDGKRVVMGGTNNIAYSDDFGMTWVATGFSSLNVDFRIIYIVATKLWFAVGYSNANNVIAYSSDGANWILSNIMINQQRCADIIYNGSVYIASVLGDYPTATSSDGITWAYNTSYQLMTSASRRFTFDFTYDGSRYIFGTSGYTTTKNIATSPDGITWSDTAYLPMDVRRIAYNGVDTYVAVGGASSGISSPIYYYWSNDLITWYPANNNLLGTTVFNGRMERNVFRNRWYKKIRFDNKYNIFC